MRVIEQTGEWEAPTYGEAALVYANSIQFSRGLVVSYPCVQSRMVLLCLDGSGTVVANGQHTELTEWDYLVLPWDHSITYRADRVRPFLLCGVHIVPWHDPMVPITFEVSHAPDHPLADSPERRDDDAMGLPSALVSDRASGPDDTLVRLVRLAVDLFRSSTFEREASNALARLILYDLIARSAGSPRGSTTGGRDDLADIEIWVLDHIHDRITLADLCRHSGMSASTLRRRFVKTTGFPPYEWIIRERVRLACDLLQTTALPIARIAERVGIVDAAYFTRLFTTRVGIAPRRYRGEHLRL